MQESTPDSELFAAIEKYCHDEGEICSSEEESRHLLEKLDEYLMQRMSKYRKANDKILTEEEERLLVMCATNRTFFRRVVVSGSDDGQFLMYAKDICKNIDTLLLVHGIITE